MTSNPDTPTSSHVAPGSFSGELIPGLPGHLVVAHVLEEGKMPDPTDVARVSAVSRGMRDAVAATKRKVKEPREYEAVEKGYLNTLKHMHKRNRLSYEELLCAAAASSGELEALKALRAENSPWDEKTCWHAANCGHLNILKWAHENGCPWDWQTCSYAAKGGHLNILKWAHANGCPWDEETCANAAKFGQLAFLKWVRENGAPE